MKSKILLMLLLMASSLFAQETEKEKEDWDVNAPPGEYQEKSLTFTEGTWRRARTSPSSTG